MTSGVITDFQGKCSPRSANFPSLLRQADFFASCRIWLNVEGPGYSSLPLHFILGFISNRFSILGVILSVCNSRSP